MTNAEGFLYIIIFISFFMFLVGCTTLTFVYFLLPQIKNKLVIILGGIVLNFALFMGGDINWLIIGTVCFAVPMTVLAPLVLIPTCLKKIPSFSRVFICYLIISVLYMILPFILIETEISMIPFLFFATPLSNGLVYICLIIGCFGLAVAFYKLIK
ncbi:MAG: hypothetical protein PHG79_02555 [Methanosarcina sp.]|jgi:hypothetical protein|nr:hypothetical protein [Methanosarcina sp.]MDD3873478.1 hypothetical protein [Methanosarcina sp.]MDD4521613.1 hypothetical protein [Methanosarcina sp.]HHV23464.1 hypothetical protein [Methanosarcina sp.]